MQPKLDTRLCKDLTTEVVCDTLSFLATPRALTVWILFKSGEHKQLIDLDLPLDNWNHAYGASGLRASYAATKLLQKSNFLELGVDRSAVAVQKGLECEDSNRRANTYLRALADRRVQNGRLNCILYAAQRILGRIFGSFEEGMRSIRFGGWTSGRNSASKGPYLSSFHKYSSRVEASARLIPIAKKLVESTPLWMKSQTGYASDFVGPRDPRLAEVEVTCVDFNTAITVPKNAKTDRLICYEPQINIYLQRPVGEWLRDRLRLITGIDLSSQSRNQALAKEGSKSGYHATLDLSSASDTICTELVRSLFNTIRLQPWYDLLNRLRSHQTLWPGEANPRVNEKFSSMGNGFTFELETAIFYALSQATMEADEADCTEQAVCYGDDIIVPVRHARAVMATLEEVGFTINRAKSFTHGSFRESCGEDYYNGVSLKSPRLESKATTLEEVMKFHNRFFEWCKIGGDLPKSLHLRNRWVRLSRDHLSHSTLLFKNNGQKKPQLRVASGPPNFGDGHFWRAFDEACPTAVREDKRYLGWEGWFYETIITLRHRRETPFKVDEASAAVLAAVAPKAPLSLLAALGDETRSVRSLVAYQWT